MVAMACCLKMMVEMKGQVVSVIGRSLDIHGEMIAAVGLNKDVSNEMSGPSPNVTESTAKEATLKNHKKSLFPMPIVIQELGV